MNRDIRYITKFVRLMAAVTMVLAGVCVVSAITLEQYKEKISNAHLLALEVEYDADDEDLTRDLIKFVRESFRSPDSIEWAGTRIETSNKWLLQKISEIEQAAEAEQREAVTIEVREYLSTVLFKIQELESLASGSTSKDEEKRKLAEILRREEFQKPDPKSESVFSRWLTRFLEWIESLFPQAEPGRRMSGSSTVGTVVQIAVYAGIAFVLGFLLYKIFPLIVPAARRRRKEKRNKRRVILGETLDDNATAVDLLGDAERLAREGNLRGAIRKGYIALLCELADRKVIGLSRHKTNRDYLRDVRTKTDLHPKMRAVTEMFESHWYGTRESSQADWEKFRDDYQNAIRVA